MSDGDSVMCGINESPDHHKHSLFHKKKDDFHSFLLQNLSSPSIQFHHNFQVGMVQLVRDQIIQAQPANWDAYGIKPCERRRRANRAANRVNGVAQMTGDGPVEAALEEEASLSGGAGFMLPNLKRNYYQRGTEQVYAPHQHQLTFRAQCEDEFPYIKLLRETVNQQLKKNFTYSTVILYSE